jgi:serine/threonine protein kinase
MEYVEGITVRELIDTRGQVGVSSTIAIGAQLAQSLDVAHRQGVIHRDVKPANLLLDEAGVLKVMDFGVACLADRTESLTHPGAIVGTPTYMAPEQLLGGNVDARSDLYSVGVVLYECLTGKPPFDADDSTPLIVRLIEEELPPPSALAPDVPPAFAALVVRLLALRPDDRLASARELAEQLAELA